MPDSQEEGTTSSFFGGLPHRIARSRLSRAEQRRSSKNIEARPALFIGDEEYPADMRTLLLGRRDLAFLPDWLGDVTTLTTLRVRRNRLRKLPDSCAQLRSLVLLDIDSNEFTVLPEWLGNLTLLERLLLGRNQLETLPATIGRLIQLGELEADHNLLTSLPDAFSRLDGLVTLSLSHNQLGELPTTIGRLASLTTLDASANQLRSLPDSFGDLTALVALILTENSLAALPESFGNLRSLTQLDLRHNALASLPDSFGRLILPTLDLHGNQLGSLPEGFAASPGLGRVLVELHLANNALSSLPDTFCQLHALTQLDLRNNQLTCLPGAFGKLPKLATLRLDDNELMMLPDTFGHLHLLSVLTLDRNKLTMLPDTFARLTQLRELSLVRNDLAVLPHTIDQLVGLTKLDLNENLLPQAPQEIATIQDELTFYAQCAKRGMVFSRCARLIVVGEALSGKSSLVQALKATNTKPAKVLPPHLVGAQPDAQTVAIEIHPAALTFCSGEESIEVSAWDVGGEKAYECALQPFLAGSGGALYVLAVRVTNADDGHYHASVGRWLDMMQMNAPGAALLLTLTHCDRLGPPVAPILVETAEAQRAWLVERVRAHAAALVAASADSMPLRLVCNDAGEPLIPCVALGADDSIRGCRAAIERAMLHQPPMLASVGCSVPKPWQATMAALSALGAGIKPLEAAMHALEHDRRRRPSVILPPMPYMRLSEARAVWRDSVAPYMTPEPSASTFDDALQLLVHEGKLICSGGLVHYDATHVLRIALPLLDHRLNRAFVLPSVLKHLTDGSRMLDHTRAAALGGKVKNEGLRIIDGVLKIASGEVREEILPIIWSTHALGAWTPVGTDAVSRYEEMLRTLVDAGILCLADVTVHGRRWVLPSHLPMVPPPALPSWWESAATHGKDQLVEMGYTLGRFAPPGLVERLVASCCMLGRLPHVWRHGAAVVAPSGAHLLVSLQEAEPTTAGQLKLLLAVRASEVIHAWRALDTLRVRAEELLADSPHLATTPATLQCPHCTAAARSQPTTWALPRGPCARVPERVECAPCGMTMELPTPPPAPRLPSTHGPSLSRRPSGASSSNRSTATSSAALAEGSTPSMPSADATRLPRVDDLDLSIPTAADDASVDERRYAARHLLLGEPMEAFFSTHVLLGLTEEQLRTAMAGGAKAVEDEVKRLSKELGDLRDVNHLTLWDWAHYLANDEAVEIDLPGGPRDRTHAGMRLADFAALPIARTAHLSEAQVLALRLYTTSAIARINGPLRRGCTRQTPHPLPATAGHLLSALAQLRATIRELPDKGKGFLFRGARTLSSDSLLDELLERGACERAVVSVTSDRLSAFKDVAKDGKQNTDAVVLLKLRVDDLHAMAPDLTWCSAFPRQTEMYNNIYEYALPPFTHLRPVLPPGQRPTEEKKMGPNGKQIAVTIVECVASLPY